MRTRAIITLKADYPLAVLLNVAGMARSTFFYSRPAWPDRIRMPS